MTANQNLIVAGVPKSQKAKIEKLARQYGLMDDAVSEQRKNSMACVAFPTCPLAMAEAERFLPEFVTDVEDILKKHGLPEEDNIILRITGCPNGCGRAMLAELGLVGKAPGRYNMHLGGNKAGTDQLSFSLARFQSVTIGQKVARAQSFLRPPSA